jgi:hypothetical protein
MRADLKSVFLLLCLTVGFTAGAVDLSSQKLVYETSSGWLTKYRIEEFCENDIGRFRYFEENSDDYSRINMRNESELFAGFRKWLARRENYGI